METNEIVRALTVQTEVVLLVTVTARPLVEVGATKKAPEVTTRFVGAVKVMVCAIAASVIVVVAEVIEV